MAEVTEQGARTLSPLHRAAALVRRRRALAPVAVLILLCIVIAVMNPRFVDPWNLVRLLNSAAVLVVLTMGATFVILLGSIDLSLEGVLALCAVLVSIWSRTTSPRSTSGSSPSGPPWCSGRASGP